MKLHSPSFSRLKEAQLRPEAIATIFEMMANLVSTCGPMANQFTLTWQQPNDEFEEDDLLPVITLSLQPAALLVKPQPTE